MELMSMEYLLLALLAFILMRKTNFAPFAMQVQTGAADEDEQEEPLQLEQQEALKNVEQMNNDELEKAINSGLTDPTQTPESPAADKAADTPKDTAGAAKDQTPDAPPAEGTKGEEKKPAAEGADDTLLAGKYKTPEELVKGTQAIAEKIGGVNAAVLQNLVKLAQKTGDWTEVAATYKQLESELGKGGEPKAADKPDATAAAAQPGQQPAPPPAQQLDLNSQQAEIAVRDEATTRLRSTELAQRMQKRGIEIPNNLLTDKKVATEFMDALEEDHPAFYVQMRIEIERLYNETKNEAKSILEAVAGHEAHTTTVRTQQAEKIINYAKQLGLELTAEAVTKEVDALLSGAEPHMFEDRYGVQYLKPEALFQSWLLKNHDMLLKQVGIQKALEGRRQHAEDIKRMRDGAPNGISTAHTPGTKGRGADHAAIDPSNDLDVAALTDDQLEASIKNGLPKKK